MDGKTARAPRNRSGQAVTMEMVGKIAGVSQVTVSRALNDPSKVSQATLKKIHDAIEVTGFVPNAIAGALASRKSRLVSALVPSVTNIVYAAMVQSFTEVMKEHGYQILLSETGPEPEQEEALIATHLSRRPDAMMLLGAHHTPNARKMLLAAGIPTVEVWDITQTPIDLCVGFSHAQSGASVAEFVVDAGYKRAAAISAPDERALRRMNAFATTFEKLTGSPAVTHETGEAASLGGGREGLARLIDERGFDGGVVTCSSDLLAHGVLTEAQARGLRVPDDIAVVGFGDQNYAPYTLPPLTTVKVDRSALGDIAAKAVLKRLEGVEDAHAVIDVGFEIIRRQSA